MQKILKKSVLNDCLIRSCYVIPTFFTTKGCEIDAKNYLLIKKGIMPMDISEENQLRAMCKFIKSNPRMFNALKMEDWATFANLYNGPSYTLNKYVFIYMHFMCVYCMYI